jgi:REP element-mobilizing transposase RayT
MNKVEKFTLFHITMVTHNSRISERMRRLHIYPGEAVRLSIKEEIKVVKEFGRIVILNKYIVFAFNICVDHVHFVIFSFPENLEKIIRKIKTKTSIEFKKIRNTALWAQKFNREVIETEEGLANVINYVQLNRIKHNYPESIELQNEIGKFITSLDNYI